MSDAETETFWFEDYDRQYKEALPWQTAEGEGVVVFFLPGEEGQNDDAEIRQKVAGFDWALQQNCRLLQEEPLPFKVHVFLFPNAESYSRAQGLDEPYEGGSAQIRSVTVNDCPWEKNLSCYATHELAHVITMQRLGYTLPGIFMEGLAVYVQNAIPETAFVNLDRGWDPPSISMEEPLIQLVVTDEFDYGHAGAFIEYLVRPSEGNMENVKSLCREIENRYGDPDAERVDQAVRAVYGLSLDELEAEWRGAP